VANEFRVTILREWLVKCGLDSFKKGCSDPEFVRCCTIVADILGQKPAIAEVVIWLLQTALDGKEKLGCSDLETIDAVLAQTRITLNSCIVDETEEKEAQLTPKENEATTNATNVLVAS